MQDAKISKETGAIPAALSAARSSRSHPLAGVMQSSESMRDPRVQITAQVRLQYDSILDFHESQSLNISRSGMFIATNNPGPVGALLDFEFALVDGLSLLKGRGEIVRVTQTPVAGMGVRFRELDDESRKCLERIVATNEREGRAPNIPLDFNDSQPAGAFPAVLPVARASQPLPGATRVQPGLSVNGQDLQIRLTPLTVGYFTNNPLINIRLGGFVVPIEDEVSLGVMFDVAIVDNDGLPLFHGRGKVVAKHERRVGIRLADVDKTVLARLQAEVGRLSPGSR